MANQVCSSGVCNSSNCPDFRQNCSSRCCTLPTVDCTIEEAVCTPILAQRIVNCLSINKSLDAYISGVTFFIEPSSETYNSGEAICIENVAVVYSALGLMENSSDPRDMSFPIMYINGEETDVDFTETSCGEDFVISNKATASITTRRCCIGSDDDNSGVITRVVQSGAEFGACRLQVIVTGRIGCKCFRAVSLGYVTEEQPPTDISYPTRLSDLGFPESITLSGSVCLPRGSALDMSQEYALCLVSNCATTNSVYTAPMGTELATFTADLEYSLSVNDDMYFTTMERMGVLASPNPITCETPQSASCNTACQTASVPSCTQTDCSENQ